MREARPSDRAALANLWVAAWRPVFPEIDFEARRGWFSRHLDDLATNGARTIVAVRNEGVAGFVTVDVGRAVIEQLAVGPSHQGGGVASDLIASAKVLSPMRLDLSVNLANAAARRLYCRHGFVEIGSGTNPLSELPILMLRWRGQDSSEID